MTHLPLTKSQEETMGDAIEKGLGLDLPPSS